MDQLLSFLTVDNAAAFGSLFFAFLLGGTAAARRELRAIVREEVRAAVKETVEPLERSLELTRTTVARLERDSTTTELAELRAAHQE